jgi:membrane dipeptidase
MFDALYGELERNPDNLVLATEADDIERAKADGAVAAVIGIEGAEALEGDLALLRVYHRMGVRCLGITWSLRNRAGDGAYEARTGGGLSRFGVELVGALNELGIMVDVAHLAPAGVRDVLGITSAPVIASHANAHSLCPVARNLSDEQLEGIAQTGGVVGVTFVPGFLHQDREKASLQLVLDHMDHMVRVMGIDHVGVGSDFDGFGPTQTSGLQDVTRYPDITAGLLDRGYAPEDVQKILGGNFMRVFRQVCG